MDQASLFYEDIYEAMRDAVRLMGGAKVVAPAIWPEKAADAAARLLLDCMNPNRLERLNQEQFLFLLKQARAAGIHGLKHFIDQEAGYERTNPTEPLDEMAALQRQFIDSVELQRRILGNIERVMSTLPGGSSAIRVTE